MGQESNSRIKLGIFVTTGIVLLVLGLYFIGNKKNMFSSSIHIYTHFENISGLRPGNNVRFSGIDIGTVDKIEILSSKKIRVEMIIDEDVVKFITLNSIASLGTDGLMGNRLVNIEPGSSDTILIKNGDEISSREIITTDEMMSTLDKTNRNISIVSEDLVQITGNINKSRGTLYSVLVDTGIAANFRSTLNNINSVSNNLRDFSNDLLALSGNIKSGKGIVGELTADSSKTQAEFNQLLKNLNEVSLQFSLFSRKLNSTMDTIQSSKGSLSVLLSDTVMSGQLKSTMTNIDTSAVQLNEYMKALRESFLFRRYFRKKDRKN